ncbi:class I SAM-dependent methyltransferase [Desulforudis sp. 1088]|uniref:class I SAM-dependent methyltransferase n=1 Tax=unclassified Candidatus Desulforudis TaxID=2635950 RepID=UPI003496E598
MSRFDELAQNYDRWYERPLGRVVEKLETDLFLTLARPCRGERVLDAGCGTGRLALLMAQMGLSVTGIDSSEAMLEVAREKLAGYPSVELLCSPLETLPLPPEYYHLVVAFTVLEFTEDPGRAVRELWRMVRPGGRLVVAVLNAWSPWAWRRRAEARLHGGIFKNAHFFQPGELVSLLARETGQQPYWQSAVFIPPSANSLVLRFADGLERWGRRMLKPWGALLIVRVDKTLSRQHVFQGRAERIGHMIPQPDGMFIE